VTTDVTTDVTPEIGAFLRVVQGEMARPALQAAMGLKSDEHFRKAYLVPAIAKGFLEMTLPDTPRSTRQRYRLTEKGRRWVKSQAGKEAR
jgi:ATP-dependent DNA helicase RecG